MKKVATCCPAHRSLKSPPISLHCNLCTSQFCHWSCVFCNPGTTLVFLIVRAKTRPCVVFSWDLPVLILYTSLTKVLKYDKKKRPFLPQNRIFHFDGKLIAGVTMFNHIFKKYLGRRSLFVVFEPGWQKLREIFYAHCESKNFALAERLSTSATLFWAVFRTTSVVVLSTPFFILNTTFGFTTSVKVAFLSTLTSPVVQMRNWQFLSVGITFWKMNGKFLPDFLTL